MYWLLQAEKHVENSNLTRASMSDILSNKQFGFRSYKITNLDEYFKRN